MPAAALLGADALVARAGVAATACVSRVAGAPGIASIPGVAATACVSSVSDKACALAPSDWAGTMVASAVIVAAP